MSSRVLQIETLVAHFENLYLLLSLEVSLISSLPNPPLFLSSSSSFSSFPCVWWLEKSCGSKKFCKIFLLLTVLGLDGCKDFMYASVR